MGEFNVSNALAAGAAALALGLPLEQVVRRLAASPQVPGRMERLADSPMVVLRDYAHTPDAMNRVLATLRPLTPGRLFLLFGCGGDRDRGKRPEMARIAVEGADVVAITSDNPRTEDPERILDDMESGMGGAPHLRITDREEAINAVLGQARRGGHRPARRQGTRDVPDRGHHQAPLRRARHRARGAARTARVTWTSASVAGRAGTPRPGAGRASATRASPPTPGRCSRARCSWRFAGSASTGTTTWPRRRAGGARARWCTPGTPRIDGLEYFEVADTVAALGLLARWRRREITGPVVAITGTNGKTSTKEMLAAALRTRFRVHATRANLNNLIGVPLTILEAPDDTDALVIEAGASVPGEIGQYRRIIEPTVAVVTNVSAGHLEGFGSLEGVLAEKLSLVEGVPLAVVGTEPPELAAGARRLARRVVTAGLEGAEIATRARSRWTAPGARRSRPTRAGSRCPCPGGTWRRTRCWPGRWPSTWGSTRWRSAGRSSCSRCRAGGGR